MIVSSSPSWQLCFGIIADGADHETISIDKWPTKMTKEHYLEIRNRYGRFASWAIWAPPGDKPKSNIGMLDLLDIDEHPELLDRVKPEVIMVGLNFSRSIESTEPFANFHDSRPRGQDYKIRYAFTDTRFYGAYMTDIIKDFPEKVAGAVGAYLRKNQEFVRANIGRFESELDDLRSKDPLIIAFGVQAFGIIKGHFRDRYTIVKVPHYSNFVSKENYRKQVQAVLPGL